MSTVPEREDQSRKLRIGGEVVVDDARADRGRLEAGERLPEFNSIRTRDRMSLVGLPRDDHLIRAFKRSVVTCLDVRRKGDGLCPNRIDRKPPQSERDACYRPCLV